jgi:multidrug efflux system membrane fusion protein
MLALALLLPGCGSDHPIPQSPQAVQTQRLRSDAATSGGRLRFSAVIEPDARVPLSFRTPGYVTALHRTRGENGAMRDIAEGDRVPRGTVLVRIRSSEYDDQVRQAASQAGAAEAVAHKADLDFDRAKHLFESRSITKPEFDEAHARYDATENQLKAARAAVSEAEIALRDTSLLAPFDGEIVDKSVEIGAFVGPTAPVFVLARTEVVKILVGVPDTALPAVTLGQPVDVAVDAFGDRAFRARISRVASAADPVTRNFDVEVAIPNPDRVLKAGMIGSLELATGTTAPRAVFRVPLSSIVDAGEGTYGVCVVTGPENAKVASLRKVEIGPILGTEISVVRGLADGDEVITSGSNLLKDGQRVEVVR